MAEYQAMHGRSLEKDVISEFSANAEKGLVGICKCLIIFLIYQFLQLNYCSKWIETVQCAQSRAGYFAQRLNNAIKGLGTKEYVKFIFLVSLFRTFLIYFNSPSENLIRILVTRCDIDLGNIKREYEKKFGRSLQADVSVMRNFLLHP